MANRATALVFGAPLSRSRRASRNVLASIEHGEGLLGQMVNNREQGATTLADLQRTVAHVEGTAATFERIVKEFESGKGAIGVLLKRGEQAQRVLANLDRATSDLASLSAKLVAAQGALPQLVLDRAYGEAALERSTPGRQTSPRSPRRSTTAAAPPLGW